MSDSNKINYKYNPTPEYKHFFYNDEGDGFVYFKSAQERDDAANYIIQNYLRDGWDEAVENVVCGEVTSKATMVDKRGPSGQLDENGNDESGEHWPYDFLCDYKLKPLGFVCPSTLEVSQ